MPESTKLEKTTRKVEVWFHLPGSCYQWSDKDSWLWSELILIGSPWHFVSVAYNEHQPAGSGTGHMNTTVVLSGENFSGWGELFDATVSPCRLVLPSDTAAIIRKMKSLSNLNVKCPSLKMHINWLNNLCSSLISG
jgi:hypothetical protein